MKVLVWDAKQGSVYWDASTPEKEAQVYLAMVVALEEFQAYEDLKGGETYVEEELRETRELKARPRGELSPDELEKLARALRHDERKMEYAARESARQRDLFQKAKAGDPNAARDLLAARREYEYEDWHFEEVRDPAEDLAEAGLPITTPLAEEEQAMTLEAFIPVNAEDAASLFTKERLRILAALGRGPATSEKALARSLRREKTSVSRDVRKLAAAGLIRTTRAGKSVTVSLEGDIRGVLLVPEEKAPQRGRRHRPTATLKGSVAFAGNGKTMTDEGSRRDKVDEAILHLGAVRRNLGAGHYADYCPVCDGVLFQSFDHGYCLAKLVLREA